MNELWLFDVVVVLLLAVVVDMRSAAAVMNHSCYCHYRLRHYFHADVDVASVIVVRGVVIAHFSHFSCKISSMTNMRQLLQMLDFDDDDVSVHKVVLVNLISDGRTSTSSKCISIMHTEQIVHHLAES